MIAQAIRVAAGFSKRLNIVKWIPKPLANAMRSCVLKRSVRKFPDRRFLEDEILPRLARGDYHRVLFVGCEPYTKSYGTLFRNQGKEYWTTDIRPNAAPWGEAERHLTADIREIDNHFESSYFDLVIFNGVVGFGVNNAEDIEQALASLAVILTCGGNLVIGWNPHLIESDLHTVPALVNCFTECRLGDLPASHVIEETDMPHRFDFFRRSENA